MTTTSSSYAAKVVIVGNSAVGKTSLLVRFSEDKYKPAYIATVGIDLIQKPVEIDGKKIIIELWDTAGQERLSSLAASFFHGATGIILAYGIDDRDSFDKVEAWLNQVQETVGDKVCKVLVANKIDLPEDKRVVQKNEGEALAQRLGIKFYETSAEKDINVQDVFYELAKEIKERILDPRAREQRERQPSEVPSVHIQNGKQPVREPADDSCRC